jgi:hypothetical protein
MLAQEVALGKRLVTLWASVYLGAVVCRFMPGEVCRRPELLPTPLTGAGILLLTLAPVRALVGREVRCAEVALPAFADVGPLAGMCANVLCQARWLGVRLGAAREGACEAALGS